MEKLVNKLDMDSLIRTAMLQAEDDWIAAELTSPEQKEPFPVSKQFHSNMKQAIQNAKQKKLHKQQVKKRLLRWAAAIVILVVTSSCFLLQSEKVRAAFSAFFLRYNQGNVDFVSTGLEIDEASINREYYYLGYIPEGYVLTKEYVNNLKTFYSYNYQTSSGTTLFFQLSSLSGTTTSSYDTEHHTIETFWSDGIQFHYFASTDETITGNILIWTDEYSTFELAGYLSKDELLKIYENIQYSPH